MSEDEAEDEDEELSGQVIQYVPYSLAQDWISKVSNCKLRSMHGRTHWATICKVNQIHGRIT